MGGDTFGPRLIRQLAGAALVRKRGARRPEDVSRSLRYFEKVLVSERIKTRSFGLSVDFGDFTFGLRVESAMREVRRIFQSSFWS